MSIPQAATDMAKAVAVEVAELWRKDPPCPPHLATLPQVAAHFRCTEKTIKNLCKRGQLRRTRMSGKMILFRWEDVHKCAEEHGEFLVPEGES